ncbi:hypothetical protein ACFVH6_39480 [Spirillospora sp. NPDC127200]
MSSAVLYLAIVAVWAIVLVPMWLRRDTETTGISRLLHKRGPDEEPTLEEDAPLDDEQEDPADEIPVTPHRATRSRAAVIARRRRRTAGLVLLLLTAITVVVAGVAPWWITIPPALLLTGHLALLRVAVGMDAARAAEEHARAREAARKAALTLPEPAPQAEVIELATRPEEEVFDQYADDRRAVGE